MLFREFSVMAEAVFFPKRISSQPFDLFLSNPPSPPPPPPHTHTHIARHVRLVCLACSSHSVMIWAAMTLAFFGFMRLGELTCNSKFSFETHLSPSDVRFLPSLRQPDYMSIQVKISKTDPFRIGHTILIWKTNQPIRPSESYEDVLGNQDQHPRAPFSVSFWLPINQRCFYLRN